MKPGQSSKRHGDATRKNRPLRILVVEDHSDLSAALHTLFRLLGYEARFVEDVASALHAAGTEAFDVLLSDIGLPDGDGWELLRRLEKSGGRPPHAIAMSGYGSGEDLARSKAAGFDLHLVKPFDPENLEKALRSVESQVAASADSAPPIQTLLSPR